MIKYIKLNSSIIFVFNKIETIIMSDFAKKLEKFKYVETNTSEIKNIEIGSTSSQPIKNNLDMTNLSIEQKYAYNKFVKGENLFITGPGELEKPI